MDDTAPILASLDTVGWPLFLALEEVWYRAGTSETGCDSSWFKTQTATSSVSPKASAYVRP